MTQHIRIASRASAMAIAQVNWLMAEVTRTSPGTVPEFVPITTAGDIWTGPLAEVGGKGSFTSAVARAVLDGRADLALHCAKDMPGDEPEPDGTVCLYPRRDDVHDVLVHPAGTKLDDLPAGTRIGTSAPRRIAQLTASHPHLTVVAVRGNADTRLGLTRSGDVDAVILALAGLRRLGREAEATEIIDTDRMTPALGAGQLALQIRADDQDLLDVLTPLTDPAATRAALAERTLLRALAGSWSATAASNADRPCARRLPAVRAGAGAAGIRGAVGDRHSAAVSSGAGRTGRCHDHLAYDSKAPSGPAPSTSRRRECCSVAGR